MPTFHARPLTQQPSGLPLRKATRDLLFRAEIPLIPDTKQVLGAIQAVFLMDNGWFHGNPSKLPYIVVLLWYSNH